MLNSDRSTTSRTTDEIVKDPRKDGAYREQSMINNARVLVFVVLVIATFAVATGCYIFTSEQERSEFENEVRFSVLLVIHSFHASAHFYLTLSFQQKLPSW